MRSGARDREIESRRSSRRTTRLLLAIGCLLAAGPAHAQTPPVDLPDLSLAELLQVEMFDAEETGARGARPLGSRLHFDYRYSRIEFKGYRDGTDRVSKSSITAAAPPPLPGSGTYLVLPTKIVQEAHTFRFTVDVFDRTNLSVALPCFPSAEFGQNGPLI